MTISAEASGELCLIVGKNIEHLLVVDHKKMLIRGRVTDISSDPLKTVYRLNNEDEDELKKIQSLVRFKIERYNHSWGNKVINTNKFVYLCAKV